MADQLIAAEEWVGALAQIDVAEEMWGAAGLLGLTGKPFEQALDDLRAKVPGYSGPFSVDKEYGAEATNGALPEAHSCSPTITNQPLGPCYCRFLVMGDCPPPVSPSTARHAQWLVSFCCD